VRTRVRVLAIKREVSAPEVEAECGFVYSVASVVDRRWTGVIGAGGEAA